MRICRDRGFYKNLLSLSLPLALSNLVTFLMTLSDSLFIGRLGDKATAGVYIGSLAATVLGMLVTGFDGGITVVASQYFGKGELKPIKAIILIGSVVLAALGLAFALLCSLFGEPLASFFLSGKSAEGAAEYLRIISLSFPFSALSGALGAGMKSIESPKITTVASTVALILNFIFDYLLIFGKLGFANMGIKGAAIATVIARAAELSILLIHVFFIDKKLKMRITELHRPNRIIGRDFFRYTMPIVLGQLVWIANTLFDTYTLSSLGSDSVVAALAIANTINSLSYIMMNALSGAMGILIGKSVGEGEDEALIEKGVTAQLIFIALGFATSIVLLAVKNPFVSLYAVSEEAAEIARSLITVLSVTIIGTSYESACLIAVVRGGGDVSFIMKLDAFFVFLVVMPLGAAAVKLGAPVWLIFLALKSDQILKCLPAAIKINRFRWAKSLTR